MQFRVFCLPGCYVSKNANIEMYKTIILPFVLYGYENSPLRLRDEQRLRMFEDRALRRVFGPRWDEMTGDWNKLHN
jgi:hypothetical protein